MSRKVRTTKAGSKDPQQRGSAAYPVAEEDLEQQRERLRRAAAAGAGAVKASPEAAAATQPAQPETPAAKPLAPLATAFPNKATTPAEPKLSPVSVAQKVSSSSPPKASPPAVKPHTPAPAAPKLLPQPAVGTAPSKPVPGSVDVSFAFVRAGASKVSLCGEFNGWSPEASPMERRENGRWEKTVSLRPGKYQYKFVVDGEWLIDPAAREQVPNPHGSLNSVVEARI